jgi:hypothetical protein
MSKQIDERKFFIFHEETREYYKSPCAGTTPNREEAHVYDEAYIRGEFSLSHLRSVGRIKLIPLDGEVPKDIPHFCRKEVRNTKYVIRHAGSRFYYAELGLGLTQDFGEAKRYSYDDIAWDVTLLRWLADRSITLIVVEG